MVLEPMGFSPFFRSSFQALGAPELQPARVTRAHGNHAELFAASGGVSALVPRGVTADSGPLVAGDWVAFDPSGQLVRHLLPRRTVFVRQAAGKKTAAQAVAANIDVVFLVMALDGDFNLRRLERYLTLSHGSGADPVVLLTKAGGCPDAEARLDEVRRVAPGVPAYAIDVVEGIDAEAPRRHLGEGITAALLGSSGVGKSTLLNHLLGEERVRTGAIRESDDRGRHTTTHRELFWLPGGGAIVDTPGMRELQLWADAAALDTAFADIEQLASACRFRDCSHAEEPGCAVREAVARGELDADRLRSFEGLRREVDANRERRHALERKTEMKKLMRAVREGQRSKYGRRE